MGEHSGDGTQQWESRVIGGCTGWADSGGRLGQLGLLLLGEHVREGDLGEGQLGWDGSFSSSLGPQPMALGQG